MSLGFPGTYPGSFTVSNFNIGGVQKQRANAAGFPGTFPGGFTIGYINIGGVEKDTAVAVNATATPSKVLCSILAKAVRQDANVNFRTGVSRFTKTMLHMDSTFVDSSGNPKTFTANGGAVISSAQSVFGGASGLFVKATTSFISTNDHSDYNLGTTPWTFRFRVQFLSISVGSYSLLFAQYESVTRLVLAYYRQDIGILAIYCQYGASVTGYMYTSWAPSLNTWYDILYARDDAGNGYIMIDGVNQSLTVVSAFSTNDIGDIAGPFTIGYVNAAVGDNPLDGYIDEFKYDRGIAEYTSNYNVANAAFSNEAVPSITIVAKTAVASTGTGGAVNATATPTKITCSVIIKSPTTAISRHATVTPNKSTITVLVGSPTTKTSTNANASASKVTVTILVNQVTAKTSRNASATPTISLVSVVAKSASAKVTVSSVATANKVLVTVRIFNATATTSVGGVGVSLTILLESKLEYATVNESRISKYLNEDSAMETANVNSSRIEKYLNSNSIIEKNILSNSQV